MNHRVASRIESMNCDAGVAQSSTLLYRRVALCEACDHLNTFRTSNAPPSATRRYSRVELCATRFVGRVVRTQSFRSKKQCLSCHILVLHLILLLVSVPGICLAQSSDDK